MHKATERFRQCFESLPEQIKKLSKKNSDLLKQNPRHPSLRFKKVGDYWSIRIGLNYRALAVQDKRERKNE